MRPRVPIGHQTAIVVEYLDAAIKHLRDITANTDATDQLAQLAIKRGTTIGSSDYGDASFHKTPRQLHTDIDEEIADAIWYAAIAAWKTSSITHQQ